MQHISGKLLAEYRSHNPGELVDTYAELPPASPFREAVNKAASNSEVVARLGEFELCDTGDGESYVSPAEGGPFGFVGRRAGRKNGLFEFLKFCEEEQNLNPSDAVVNPDHFKPSRLDL